MARTLMKGNEALARAAILSGCTHFFGYPITPQNEIPEYLARELPRNHGVYLQAESELAAIHMVYGAAASGARVMTSSSSPGIALMQEGISMLAGAELPCVVVNVQRGGPGIGGIQPSQADYYQATRGGGNGGYRVPAFAPSSIQESVDMMQHAFDLADRYRTPVYIVSDGMLGQMMEPVSFKKKRRVKAGNKEWAAVGHLNSRKPNLVKTLYLDPERLEEHNLKLQAKYEAIQRDEVRYELNGDQEPEVIITAFGSTARIARNAIDILQKSGVRAGLLRPMTLWPFPRRPFAELPDSCTRVFCVEMNCGQMKDDVELALKGRIPVSFFGRSGGMIPSPMEIADRVRQEMEKE